MFKKPVIVAVGIKIKGIGCGGWFEARALSLRPADREDNKRICASVCCSKGAAFSVRSPAVERV
jgi:hypothetical protein